MIVRQKVSKTTQSETNQQLSFKKDNGETFLCPLGGQANGIVCLQEGDMVTISGLPKEARDKLKLSREVSAVFTNRYGDPAFNVVIPGQSGRLTVEYSKFTDYLGWHQIVVAVADHQ